MGKVCNVGRIVVAMGCGSSVFALMWQDPFEQLSKIIYRRIKKEKNQSCFIEWNNGIDGDQMKKMQICFLLAPIPYVLEYKCNFFYFCGLWFIFNLKEYNNASDTGIQGECRSCQAEKIGKLNEKQKHLLKGTGQRDLFDWKYNHSIDFS
jgi:hypothetical protein